MPQRRKQPKFRRELAISITNSTDRKQLFNLLDCVSQNKYTSLVSPLTLFRG